MVSLRESGGLDRLDYWWSTATARTIEVGKGNSARLGFAVVAFTALTAGTYPIARYRMFTQFMNFDDEGYMLIHLKQFLDNGWRYDGANGYGIFYYEFWSAIYSILGMPVDNNSGRTVVMVVWILVSLLVGLASWRITRSIILGLAVQVSVFETMFSLIAEPMHPGSLIVLLLAIILVVASIVSDRLTRWPLAVISAAAVALLLIKINVGLFACVALALVSTVSYPALAKIRWLRLAAEIGFVVLPLVLLRARLDHEVTRRLALHVCVAALAIVIVLRAGNRDQRDSRELWWLIGGAFGVGVVVPGVVLFAGTAPGQLIEGTITGALRFGGLIFRMNKLPNANYLLDILALIGAVSYWYLASRRKLRPGRGWIWIAAVLSIGIGIFLAFPMIWSLHLRTDYAAQGPPAHIRWAVLAFSWVALIPPPRGEGRETQFARLLLPPLAILQALHVFPSAGEQLWWATFLFIPTGAVCIANGVRWISFGIRQEGSPQELSAIRAIAPIVTLAILASNVGWQLRQDFTDVRGTYNANVSLRLHGAEKIYISRDRAVNYQKIVKAIQKNCRSFVSVPGLNSFYLWTQQNPPAGYQPYEVPALLDAARQREMVQSIRSMDGLCLLRYPRGTRWWRDLGDAVPNSPLIQYIDREKFVRIGEFGYYSLFKRQAEVERR